MSDASCPDWSEGILRTPEQALLEGKGEMDHHEGAEFAEQRSSREMKKLTAALWNLTGNFGYRIPSRCQLARDYADAGAWQ